MSISLRNQLIEYMRIRSMFALDHIPIWFVKSYQVTFFIAKVHLFNYGVEYKRFAVKC